MGRATDASRTEGTLGIGMRNEHVSTFHLIPLTHTAVPRGTFDWMKGYQGQMWKWTLRSLGSRSWESILGVA